MCIFTMVMPRLQLCLSLLYVTLVETKTQFLASEIHGGRNMYFTAQGSEKLLWN